MSEPQPCHLWLGELIKILEEQPDKGRVLPLGFRYPHSYRGYYDELAFELVSNVTVAQMLADAKGAVGATFDGWKGGEYKMGEYTDCWLVQKEGQTGESLGALLLHFMLRDRS